MELGFGAFWLGGSPRLPDLAAEYAERAGPRAGAEPGLVTAQ
jgi:hypothetical protein